MTSDIEVSNHILVDGLIDGVNITKLADDAIYVDGMNQSITGNVSFENLHVASNIFTTTLNNKNITKIVEDALMLIGDQEIKGNQQIGNLTVLGDVELQKYLNGFNFTDEVVLLNKEAILKSEKSFTNTLKVDNLNIAEFVNNLNLTDIAANSLYVNKDSTVSGNITFLKDLLINGNLFVEGLIDGINLTELIENAFLKDSNENISSSIYFDDVVFTDVVRSSDLFDGVNLEAFERNVIYKCYGPNRFINSTILFDNVVINDSSVLQNLNTTSNINNIDLKNFKRDVVTISGNHTIAGTKTIDGNLLVQDLEATFLNGFSFPSDFVILHENETIFALKVFQDNVSVDSDLNMKDAKTINEKDLSEFYKKIVTKNRNHNITTPIQFLNVTNFHKNLDAKSINSVQVSSEKLLLRSYNQNITGVKNFTSVYAEGDIVSNNHINGHDLSKLENEIVLSGRVNQIDGLKTIVGDVSVDGKS